MKAQQNKITMQQMVKQSKNSDDDDIKNVTSPLTRINTECLRIVAIKNNKSLFTKE